MQRTFCPWVAEQSLIDDYNNNAFFCDGLGITISVYLNFWVKVLHLHVLCLAMACYTAVLTIIVVQSMCITKQVLYGARLEEKSKHNYCVNKDMCADLHKEY
jgi:hypothetical protein